MPSKAERSKTAGELFAQLLNAPEGKRKDLEQQFLEQSARQLGGAKVTIERKRKKGRGR